VSGGDVLSNDGLLVGSYVRGNEVVWQVVLLVVMEKNKVDGRKWERGVRRAGLQVCVGVGKQ
jgi:hypothetical protein